MEGLGLADWVPWPVALLAGAGWAVLIGPVAFRPRFQESSRAAVSV
ncbi:hypothetical protein [Dactylosporangium sp. NPDC051541]